MSAGLNTTNIPSVELPVLQGALNYDIPGQIRGTFKKPNEAFSYEQILMVNKVIHESLNDTTQLPDNIVQMELDSQNSVRNILVSNDIRDYESDTDDGPETDTNTTKRRRSSGLDTSSGVVMSIAKCDKLTLLRLEAQQDKDAKEINRLQKSSDLAAKINHLTNKKQQLIAQYYGKPYNVLLGELKLVRTITELQDIYQSLAITDGKIKKSNLNRDLLEEEICKLYYIDIRKEPDYKNVAVISSSQQILPSIPVQRRVASSSHDSGTAMKESVPFPSVSINNHERSVNNSHGTRSLFSSKNK